MVWELEPSLATASVCIPPPAPTRTQKLTEESGELAAHLQRPLHSVGAGAGVGIARVHDERPHLVPQILHADHHRCGAEPVAREDPRDGGAPSEAHDQKITAIRLLDAGHGDAELHSGDGMQRGRIRRRQVHRHDLIS